MKNSIKGVIVGVIAGLIIGGAPALADGPGSEPVADVYATQDPAVWGSWINRPCATPYSVNCYVDVIGTTGQPGWSYWRIRVGHKVCTRYWEPRYNRKHGHCSRIVRPVR